MLTRMKALIEGAAGGEGMQRSIQQNYSYTASVGTHLGEINLNVKLRRRKFVHEMDISPL